MTPEERQKKLADAKQKLGKPFITATPICRSTEKGWRLREIESRQKEEAKRRNVVSLKKDAK